MKKKSTIVNLVILTILFSSCSRFSVVTFQPDKTNGSACPNPIYIATMSKSSLTKINDSKNTIIDDNGVVIPDSNRTSNHFNQESLTLVSLLADARSKFGQDVTIQNVRWDLKNGKTKIGVLYDVIRCK